MSFAERIADELVALGVSGDGVIVVHTAFSAFGGGAGAPADLIAALRMAAGPHGTVVMPSMSDDDEEPFDRQNTPCAGMGIVADTFWRMPDVIRSAATARTPSRPSARTPPKSPRRIRSMSRTGWTARWAAPTSSMLKSCCSA